MNERFNREFRGSIVEKLRLFPRPFDKRSNFVEQRIRRFVGEAKNEEGWILLFL